MDEQEEKQDISIVELFNLVYDSNKKTLKYEIIPDNATSIELPSDFGQNTFVIDLDKENDISQQIEQLKETIESFPKP